MSKLANCRAAAALPAQDLGRLRKFYEDTLGFRVVREDGEEGVQMQAGEGTSFYVFRSMGRPSGDHTQLNFEVDDLDAVMAEMKEAGVTFETYDYPEFKSDANGVVEIPGGGGRGAWFKDPEGNLIALGEGM